MNLEEALEIDQNESETPLGLEFSFIPTIKILISEEITKTIKLGEFGSGIKFSNYFCEELVNEKKSAEEVLAYWINLFLDEINFTQEITNRLLSLVDEKTKKQLLDSIMKNIPVFP